MGEILAAIIGVALGALTTYVFDIRRERVDRRKAAEAASAGRQELRRSIATALLQDLKALEPLLRQFYHAPKPGLWLGKRSSLFFDAMRPEVRHLLPNSIPDLVDFFRMAEDVFAMIEAATPDLRRDDAFNYRLRVQAGFALQGLPAARAILIDNGGHLPPPRVLEVVNTPDLPRIPPRVFPDVAVQGAELPEELR